MDIVKYRGGIHGHSQLQRNVHLHRHLRVRVGNGNLRHGQKQRGTYLYRNIVKAMNVDSYSNKIGLWAAIKTHF